MGVNETSMGGEERVFPSTRWSMIRAARDPGSPAHREAVNHLCRLYWKPAYAYIWNARHPTREDAKDLTQAFFLEVLEGGMLRRYSLDRGSFRDYLRGAIRLFLLEQHEKASALKRGGGRKVLSLDDIELEPIEAMGTASDQKPEGVFDQQWARSVLEHSVEDLRKELVGTKKEVYFTVYERYELKSYAAGAPTYGAVAAELGLKETDVSNYLKYCRKRLRDLLLQRIGDYVDVHEKGSFDSEFCQIMDGLGIGSR